MFESLDSHDVKLGCEDNDASPTLLAAISLDMIAASSIDSFTFYLKPIFSNVVSK